MRSKNRILKLIAGKLANEATGEELEELDRLLKSDPKMREQAKLLSDWWHNGEEDDPRHTVQLFEKIKQRIGNSE